MLNRRCGFAALVLGSALALPASAQTIKPGLWEMHTSRSSTDGQLQGMMAEIEKRLAAMPPEQRKMMEQMLAGQGVQLGKAGTDGISVKACITPEMAARDELPLQQGSCTQKRSAPRNGTTTVSFSCTNPRMEGEVSLLGDSAYRARMTLTAGPADHPRSTTSDLSGKWLGPDCGDVKPVGLRQGN